MNGWMFFPAEKSGTRTRNRDIEVIFESFPGYLSEDEWHENVPESIERKQGRSIGFYCGGGIPSGAGTLAAAEIPAYPMNVFRSDLMIMPVCWTYRTVLTVPPVFDQKYKWNRPHTYRFVLTVTGTFADRPPSLRVCGSYCFFPPPYRLAKGDAGGK